jgi:hypothetical protein
MIRYCLDDLGWYQFEWLTQALLKNMLGPAIEAWGGSGDWGRDAYSHNDLNFGVFTVWKHSALVPTSLYNSLKSYYS